MLGDDKLNKMTERCKHPCNKNQCSCPLEKTEKEAESHIIPEDCYDQEKEPCEWLEKE